MRGAGLPAERVHVGGGVVPHLQRGPAHEREEHRGELELGGELLGGEDRRRDHLPRFRHQLHAETGEPIRPLLEVRLPDGQLRGARLEHDRVARPGFGHGGGGGDQDVDLAIGAELELVDVGLRLRARATAHRPLAERGAERHAEVRALTPVPDEPIGARVVEHAERVVHVRVVHQELLVLVLEGEELGVGGIGPLHDPVEGQPGEPGHPPVPLGEVDVGLGHPRRLAHDIEGRRLCLHPGVECCV